jgi:L-2,4-diaminobutyric acid acetyltransferase
LKKPELHHGGAVAALIHRCPPLDRNSTYYYHIMCRDFAQTSCLALKQGEVLGYVSAFLRPESPDTLFVWQVAVDPQARGLGLAKSMLEEILHRPELNLKRLETTIGPANKASQRLFQSLAQKMGCPIRKSVFLSEEDFSEPGHESEDLYSIDLQ